MSDNPRRPHAEVLAVAQEIVEWLTPSCERIEIAGSLRRNRPMVGDIEIVAIPQPTLDLLGEPTGLTHVDFELDRRGITLVKNGAKMKQFFHEGTQVDLFLCTPDNWGYILMLRTGSAAFSQDMVTTVEWGGNRPAEIATKNGNVYKRGILQTVPDEETLFSLWGMEFVPPEKRW